ncbi:Protein SPTL-1 a [Aphelenchoides avenae]|nr:Protein SPTL-1 a [Aphelenchus avenae]
MASMENAIASTGGFCARRFFGVTHHRLSGLGYCFSASLPLRATAASEALRIMESETDKFERLRRSAKSFHDRIRAAVGGAKFRLYGYHLSPMKHLTYDSSDADLVERKLTEFVDRMFEKGVVVSRARYLDNEDVVKLMTSSELSEDEPERALAAVTETLQYFIRN